MAFLHDRHISGLSASHLSVERQDCPLFAPVSFKLGVGELLWIQGPNGIGKSSLLRALCGLLPAVSGQIRWGEQTQVPLGNIVYLGHQPGLRTALTVLENLASDGLPREVALTALRRYGLTSLLDAPVHTLSRGQCQRVALAKLSQANFAQLWILDEPFTALDIHGQAILQADLVTHCHNGGLVVVASHQRFDLNIPTQLLDLKRYE